MEERVASYILSLINSYGLDVCPPISKDDKTSRKGSSHAIDQRRRGRRGLVLRVVNRNGGGGGIDMQ
jgi:hypothetical protein